MWDVTKLGKWWRHVTIGCMTSVTAHEIFEYCPPLYMQVSLFVWLNAKIEKISTKDKFENYGFFCTILYDSNYSTSHPPSIYLQWEPQLSDVIWKPKYSAEYCACEVKSAITRRFRYQTENCKYIPHPI